MFYKVLLNMLLVISLWNVSIKLLVAHGTVLVVLVNVLVDVLLQLVHLVGGELVVTQRAVQKRRLIDECRLRWCWWGIGLA